MCAILLKMKSGMFCEIYYIKSIVQDSSFFGQRGILGWRLNLKSLQFSYVYVNYCLC